MHSRAPVLPERSCVLKRLWLPSQCMQSQIPNVAALLRYHILSKDTPRSEVYPMTKGAPTIDDSEGALDGNAVAVKLRAK